MKSSETIMFAGIALAVLGVGMFILGVVKIMSKSESSPGSQFGGNPESSTSPVGIILAVLGFIFVAAGVSVVITKDKIAAAFFDGGEGKDTVADESSGEGFNDVDNGAPYGESGTMILGGGPGDESGSSMRGAPFHEAPLSGSGLSGAPGDYPGTGDMGAQIKESSMAAVSDPIGVGITDEDLAAYVGFLNPGSSQTMLISHGSQIGIDTVGQTMRNRSRDIRGEPVITSRGFTGPFGESTITHSDLDNERIILANG